MSQLSMMMVAIGSSFVRKHFLQWNICTQLNDCDKYYSESLIPTLESITEVKDILLIYLYRSVTIY